MQLRWFDDHQKAPDAKVNKIYDPLPPDSQESYIRNSPSDSQPYHRQSSEQKKEGKKDRKSHKCNDQQMQNKKFRKKIIKTNMAKVTNRSKIRKGKEKQTSNLSKFLFCIFKKLFEAYYLTHRLNQQQIASYKLFLQEKGKLRSYEVLMKNEIFKQIFISQVQSSRIASKILTSQKMGIKNKLIALKFLENIRSVGYSKTKKWKTR